MYEPFFYMLEHPDQLRLKIFYFTLEMSAEEKYNEFLCHLLYRLSGFKIRLSPVDLKSTNKDNPVPKEVLDLLLTDEYQRYIQAFNSCVEYIDDIKNPTGINKYCRNYALEHGKLHMTTKPIKDEETGATRMVDAIDYYEPDDEDEYRIIIADNASNLTMESGMDIMGTINKMSKYFVTLRNQMYFTPVLIQHQNLAQEGIENVKLDKIKPSANGLSECKNTIKDINTSIGIYSPVKYGIQNYEKYDITKFKNNIRFIETIEDRDNNSVGMICPLFFDGAVSYFSELPLPNDKVNIEKIYRMLDDIRGKGGQLFMAIGDSKCKNKLWSGFKNLILTLKNELI